MNVKEAAQKAAAYTVDMETILNPDNKALFLTKSGFAIESTRFDEAEDCWYIGVGFVREFDRAGIEGIAALSSIVERKPLQGARTYKTVTVADKSGEVVAYE